MWCGNVEKHKQISNGCGWKGGGVTILAGIACLRVVLAGFFVAVANLHGIGACCQRPSRFPALSLGTGDSGGRVEMNIASERGVSQGC